MNMYISRLFVHPIKSVAGLELSRLTLDEFGPLWDRRWMLVDQTGLVVSQRTDPRLALVRLSLDTSMQISSHLMPDALTLPLIASGERVRVRHITADEHDAIHVTLQADQWFSRLLGRSVRLVQFAGEPTRMIDPNFSASKRFTSLNDGFPLLIATESSLEHLNRQLESRGEAAVTWARFRPNIVIAGDFEAHAEDSWQRLRIGAIELELVKPCARCSIIMTDPQTAAQGKEPMRTLASYRTLGGKVLFAQNAIHHGLGTIERAQKIEVCTLSVY